MWKRIGGTLAVLVGLTITAGPALADSPTLAQAEATVSASPYVEVWHQPHHGYTLTPMSHRVVRIPVRWREVHTCRGDLLCRTAIVDYYHGLHHQWLTLNRNLWVLAAVFPLCTLGATDCLPPVKDNGPLVVTFNSVDYIARHVPARV